MAMANVCDVGCDVKDFDVSKLFVSLQVFLNLRKSSQVSLSLLGCDRGYSHKAYHSRQTWHECIDCRLKLNI